MEDKQWFGWMKDSDEIPGITVYKPSSKVDVVLVGLTELAVISSELVMFT